MSFLPASRLQFAYYKSLGDQTLARLTETQLHWQPNPESNSIATIVKHLHGNMHSRWTDFLTTDGEKDFRDRDGEFTPDAADKTLVLERWASGWQLVFEALDAVETSGDTEQLVYIRAKGHTATEATCRQLCHYAYHVGQITYIGRTLLGEDWPSLSIPRGASEAYNAASFGQGKRREHFTREFLRD